MKSFYFFVLVPVAIWGPVYPYRGTLWTNDRPYNTDTESSAPVTWQLHYLPVVPVSNDKSGCICYYAKEYPPPPPLVYSYPTSLFAVRVRKTSSAT